MGTVYKFTLDEYKAFKQERNALEGLQSNIRTWIREEKYSGEAGPHLQYAEHWIKLDAMKPIYGSLSGSDALWQGEDADSYERTIRGICEDLDEVRSELLTALQTADTEIQTRLDELNAVIASCESGANLSLLDYTVVNVANTFGFEVI